MTKNFYNLTNGLKFNDFLSPHSFIRIQSTACEQRRWDFILQDLDNDFLFNLAIGTECVVYDLSENKNETRALFQGLEWIKFVLYKRWLDKKYTPIVKGNNCTDYFTWCYECLDKRTKIKIDYFRKFVGGIKELKIKKVKGNLKRRNKCANS